MKVIILAGGFGTRLSEYTDSIPKPMVQLNKKPIITHIMNTYSKYGFNNFTIALGYKSKIITNYFANKKNLNKKWDVTLVNTGINTMTGGRLKRLMNIIGKETFMMTYGDGLCNVNINSLLKFHKNHKKLVTVTAVRPPARFGSLDIKGNKVFDFREKSQLDEGWINGGYFVVEPAFLKFIKNDQTYLEKYPLRKVARLNQLRAYKHDGFWQCMDTKRDKDNLEKLARKRKMPWLA